MLFLITVATSIQIQLFGQSILRDQACSFCGKIHFFDINLLWGTISDSQITQPFFRGFYWKLADGWSLKDMITLSLVIIIQWICPPLVSIWQFLDYIIKMLIFSDYSPEIIFSEGKSCFYFKVLVNDVAPWILRVLLTMLFLQSWCLLKGSTDK